MSCSQFDRGENMVPQQITKVVEEAGRSTSTLGNRCSVEWAASDTI